jgi:hypothetical protein
MGDHVDRDAGGVLPAPAVGEVEQASASDQGADLVEACAELLGAGLVHVEVVLVPVRCDAVLALLEPGEHVVHPVVRIGDESVESHRHVGDNGGHRVSSKSVRVRPGSPCERFVPRGRSRPLVLDIATDTDAGRPTVTIWGPARRFQQRTTLHWSRDSAGPPRCGCDST